MDPYHDQCDGREGRKRIASGGIHSHSVDRLLLHARRTHASGPRWGDLNTSASLVVRRICKISDCDLFGISHMQTIEAANISEWCVRRSVGGLMHNFFVVLYEAKNDLGPGRWG